jgi:subtilase family serine protease
MGTFYAPQTAKDGEKVQIVVTVENIGTADAGPFKVGITDSSAAGATAYSPQQMSGLKAGDVDQLSFDVTFSATGQHTIITAADVDREIAESNEGNNSATDTTSVVEAPKADLFCGQTLHRAANRHVTFVISCLNNGYGDAGPFSLEYGYGYRSATGGGGGSALPVKYDGLASGQSLVLRPTFDLSSAGHYTFRITIDTDHQVAESNEDNNESAGEYDIP